MEHPYMISKEHNTTKWVQCTYHRHPHW
jgi:hypothetical protein